MPWLIALVAEERRGVRNPFAVFFYMGECTIAYGMFYVRFVVQEGVVSWWGVVWFTALGAVMYSCWYQASVLDPGFIAQNTNVNVCGLSLWCHSCVTLTCVTLICVTLLVPL
eukprot:TRINITY_DN3759_c0_g1_i3.p2 TRINITY_DN3759_c0_g1~~TRINITY_DN3759_c0_g1_i3.p2  ORF type:complete len:112 (-),score=18.00 TRINITY_DN3759_c0_g1_i3:845-1180(-)